MAWVYCGGDWYEDKIKLDFKEISCAVTGGWVWLWAPKDRFQYWYDHFGFCYQRVSELLNMAVSIAAQTLIVNY